MLVDATLSYPATNGRLKVIDFQSIFWLVCD